MKKLVSFCAGGFHGPEPGRLRIFRIHRYGILL